MRASSFAHVILEYAPGLSALRSFCSPVLFIPSDQSIHSAASHQKKGGRHGVVLKHDNHSLMLEGVMARVPGGLEGAGRIQ